MDRMGAQEGEVLTHPLITRSIEQAQKRVELQNFQAASGCSSTTT